MVVSSSTDHRWQLGTLRKELKRLRTAFKQGIGVSKLFAKSR